VYRLFDFEPEAIEALMDVFRSGNTDSAASYDRYIGERESRISRQQEEGEDALFRYNNPSSRFNRIARGGRRENSGNRLVVKRSKVIKVLKKNGWYVHKQKGGHLHFKHPKSEGKITVSMGHKRETVSPQVLKNIERMSGINFRELNPQGGPDDIDYPMWIPPRERRGGRPSDPEHPLRISIPGDYGLSPEEAVEDYEMREGAIEVTDQDLEDYRSGSLLEELHATLRDFPDYRERARAEEDELDDEAEQIVSARHRRRPRRNNPDSMQEEHRQILRRIEALEEKLAHEEDEDCCEDLRRQIKKLDRDMLGSFALSGLF
jgi:predicted RNA binding protein YcfA (HicA-like mRNA interferase family)